LLNAILIELHRNIVDDSETQLLYECDETQVPESQGSNIPNSKESQQVATGLIDS